MKNINDIMKWGGKAAAQQMYKDGQGLESNPFPRDHKQHEVFMVEMSRLQHEEFKELMGAHV